MRAIPATWRAKFVMRMSVGLEDELSVLRAKVRMAWRWNAVWTPMPEMSGFGFRVQLTFWISPSTVE